jgi:hypothetical protein
MSSGLGAQVAERRCDLVICLAGHARASIVLTGKRRPQKAAGDGSHVAGDGLAAASVSMNGHKCIRWPLIRPGSISTT